MKTGIVLEGGALRTIFSAGVCDAFLDAGLMPDYLIGVSAGAAYGVSYLSRQKWRNLNIVCHYANDRRYMSWRNMLNPKNRSYFGLTFSYETIPNELIPFDYETFAAYPGTVEAVVTNLNTGRADYLPVIAWGQLAVRTSQLQVGDSITLEGRVQSRTYHKVLDDGSVQDRIAYEVSMMHLLFPEP